MRPSTPYRETGRFPLVALVALVATGVAAVALLTIPRLPRAEAPREWEARPRGVMGTTCRLLATASESRAREALRRAEAAIRRVEALTSTWIDSSEVSILNRSAADVPVDLSAPVIEILMASRAVTAASEGAFDPTCRPLVDLWRAAADSGRPPAASEVAAALELVGSDTIRLLPGAAIKRRAGARVDLGGVAKGYAIDRAIEALLRAGCGRVLVEVGGDLRCAGSPDSSPGRIVDVRHPDGSGRLLGLRIRDAAVCSSGHYARSIRVGERRYSHIVDPRSGSPVPTRVSSTVVAPSALVADAWATALTVLGPAALPRLGAFAGVEALVAVAEAEAEGGFRFHATPGWPRLVDGDPGIEIEVVSRPR